MQDESFDVRPFERKVKVRPMERGDIPAIIELGRVCFPNLRPWKPEQLENHLRIFPEGQIVVEVDGQVVGSSSSLIVEFAEFEEHHDFATITEHGTLETHDPEGENLYGIEIMVHPDVRNMRVGKRLYEARKKLAEEHNLESIIIAGRMPGYTDHADVMTPHEYLRAVAEHRLYDSVLTFQMNNGFAVKRLLPEYLPRDGESRGNAVLMEWNNIEHRPVPRRITKASRPVRICAIQYQMREVRDFEEFAAQCEYFVDVASNYKSDFALFPELLTTQLFSFMGTRDAREACKKLATFTERYVSLFRDLAVSYNVNILAGTHLVDEGDALRNVAFLFQRDGTINRQEKIHITPNERRWWGTQPGSEIRVFDTDSGKVGIEVCYDVEFPEMARLQVEAGARILFVPFCTEDRQSYLRVRYCAQARAIENQVYTVMAGTVGNLPETENMDVQYAQSAILTPSDFPFPRDGIQAEASPNVEMVVVGDIDLEVLRRHRKSGTVMQLKDRRTDLYELRLRVPPVPPTAKGSEVVSGPTVQSPATGR